MKNNWVLECLDLFFQGSKEEAYALQLANFNQNLYKYKPLNQFAIESLETGKLYMAKLSQMNDPFECYPTAGFKQQIMLMINEQRENMKMAGMIISDEEMNDINQSSDPFNFFLGLCRNKGFQHVLNKEKHEKMFYKLMARMNNHVDELIRIQCFSEINSSTIMWSHYANCHRGICIEYNTVDFGHKLPLFPVDYANQRVDITELENLHGALAKKMMYQMMLVKATDWGYEREWRVIYNLSEGENTHQSIYIQSPKPTAIYLGQNYSLNDHRLCSRLEKAARTFNIPLIPMRLDYSEFKMVPNI